MKRSLFALALAALALLLLNSCATSAPEVGKPVKRIPERQAALAAPLSALTPMPAAKAENVRSAAADTALPPVLRKKDMQPYAYTLVDSASMNSELTLTRSRLLMEEDSAGKADADSGLDPAAQRTRVTQGFRIQIYATTDFKDAERKKEDLLGLLTEPVYVIYEAPYYKIRAGNFADENEAKTLKRKLSDMGYDAWVVQSKIRVRG
ncbi:MAG: SPOR domain-containing protein [Fibrobacterota bacterium]